MNVYKRFQKWDTAKFFNIVSNFRGSLIAKPELKDNFLSLQDWIPEQEPKQGDSFYGMDRSIDTRLSGLRRTIDPDTGDFIEEIHQCTGLIAREGGVADIMLVPPKVQKLLGVNTTKITCAYGYVDVLEEPSLEKDIFFLHRDSWRKIDILGGGVICLSPGYNLRLSWAEAKKTSCECGAKTVGSSLHSSWCPSNS